MSRAIAPLVAGRYRLEHAIADGGMGRVWSAVDTRLGRRVAVKFLRPELASDPAVRMRFQGEARAAALLTHPNVVQIYDSGTDGGLPYLVMELLPGRTLAHEVAEAGPLDEARVRALGREILGALAAAHAVGIVHRDVKPGNVLLTADGTAKVADFGIAKIADAATTQTGEIMGTVAYMAPERFAGEPATARTDVYSVGAVLFEALTGRPPFDGHDPWAAADAIRDGHRPSVRALRPDVDPALADAVERAMAVDPAGRFGSAAEMAAALAARTPSSTRPLPPTQPLRAVEPARRRRGLTLTLVLLVAVMVAVLAVGALFREAPPDGPSPAGTLPRELQESLQRLEEAVQP